MLVKGATDIFSVDIKASMTEIQISILQYFKISKITNEEIYILSYLLHPLFSKSPYFDIPGLFMMSNDNQYLHYKDKTVMRPSDLYNGNTYSDRRLFHRPDAAHLLIVCSHRLAVGNDTTVLFWWKTWWQGFCNKTDPSNCPWWYNRGSSVAMIVMCLSMDVCKHKDVTAVFSCTADDNNIEKSVITITL